MTDSGHMDGTQYFLEIYGGVKRAGPGSSAATTRAFELMGNLPSEPEILDVGCGPGAQTVDLLRLSNGRVLALDLLPMMLERTTKNVKAAGLAEHLEVVEQDMTKMIFAPQSFDVIWSEGAIYNMGFEAGLNAFWNLVKPGGYVAVTDAVWLRTDPPDPVLQFWKAYPEIDTVATKRSVITAIGYEDVGHFVLPASAWKDEYYDPMAQLIETKRQA